MTSNKPTPSERRLPVPTPETRHFWEGTLVDELRLQRCVDCRHTYFPPRPFCASCGSRAIEVFAASGRARLHAYVINQRPGPGFDGPHSIAVVELDEGPRMMTNIVDCDQTPEALAIDMPVEVVFEAQTEEIVLPLFRPSTGSADGRPT